MSKRILIIDDEEHIRRMMRITLEASGYVVGDAQDGSEGLKLYGDGSNWDGVVLDQRMPGIEMNLDATCLVEKPLTPDVLRNAVAAALVKSSTAVTPTAVQTITMNGFTIFDDHETPLLEARQRRFEVVSPDGQKHDVLVEIENEPIEYVERMTRHRLPPDNSFWTAQARRLLSDFLWNEGKVPPMRRLVLQSLDPDRLPVA